MRGRSGACHGIKAGLQVVLGFLLATPTDFAEAARGDPGPPTVAITAMNSTLEPDYYTPLPCNSDSDCNQGVCQQTASTLNETLSVSSSVCTCGKNWVNYEGMACSYRQVNKAKAFLLSVFFGWLGVDWFILARGNGLYNGLGVLKFVLSTFLSCFWTPCCLKPLGPCGLDIAKLLEAGSFVWCFTDSIRILVNVFPDGNNVSIGTW